MTDMSVLTLDHPRWREFVHNLVRAICTRCSGSLKGSIKVMEEMGDIDVRRTVLHFQNNGGHCDCEVLMNVDRPVHHRADTHDDD
jgi:hypothetical protein